MSLRRRLDEIGPGSKASFTGPKKFKKDKKKEKKQKFGKITTVTKGDNIDVTPEPGSMMADKMDNTDFQKKIKSVKPQGDYETKGQAKRAFLAGLIRKMTKKGGGESTAEDMIDLVLEGYDPFDIVEKFPFAKNKKKCKDDEDDE